MAITRDLWIVLRARDEASRIVRSFSQNVSGAASSAAANVSSFERRMNELGHTLNQFAMTSMLAGTAMAGFGAAGLAFMKETVQVAVEYENQVRRTLTQVDDIKISLQDLADVGRRVAREVEIPFEQMQETLFFIFSSMNVNLEEAERLLKGFAKEAVAGQTTIEAAARSNIAIMNALGLTVNDLTRIQDVQFQVVRKGVITYDELANTIGRVLPAAARSGQSIETVGAMMAFLTRNGLSAAMASASAARALESFAHPKTVERLEQIGVKVRDARGEFLPLITVMEQMNKKLKEMSQPERAAFFQELFKGAGGTIQARRFWDTAFKNFDDFQQMMGFMSNSAGVFENAYGNMANSVVNKSILLQNKWKLIQETLGRAVIPHLLMLMNQLGKVLDWFERLPEPTKNLIAQIILFGSVISIAVGALVIFVGILAFFVSGIMMAGPALVGVLAAITALTVGIVALGTAIYAAWQNSVEFRNLLGEIGNYLSEVWGQVKASANDLKKSFDDNLRPALERLWDILKTKVFPVLTEFIAMVRETVIPKLREAGSIISDIFTKTFEYMAKVVNDVVVPAIAKLVSWWDKNKETIKPFLEYVAQLVKWLLIIGGAILALSLGAFVTSILLVIASVNTLINVFKFLWHWLVTLYNAAKDLVTFIISKFVEGFNTGASRLKSVWETIKSVISTAIQFIKDAIRTGMEFIYNNTWVPFWNMFGGLIKEIWGLIGDIIRLGTVLVTEIIRDWIIPLYQEFVSSWHEFVKIVTDVWNAIYDTVSGWARTIREFVMNVFNQVRDFVVDVWNKVRNKIIEVTQSILDVIRPIWNRIVEFVSNIARQIRDRFVNAWDDLVSFVKGAVQAILDFFKNSGRWLYDTGKGIIQGLIDGITEKVKELRKKLKEITDEIPKWKGPLAVDLKLLSPVGKHIMQGLMTGIASQVPMLQQQLQGITTQISQIPSPTLTLPTRSLAPESTGERNITQYITVNTQEIDPRVTATELGWELGNRL